MRSLIIARQRVISTSKGANVIGRFIQGGTTPLDQVSKRIYSYVPSFIKNELVKIGVRRLANSVYNLDDLCLSTDSNENSTIVNDEICVRIASGKVKVKPSIEKTCGNTVYFANGTVIENVDTIILCTGYQREFSFFEDSFIDVQKNGKYLPLYKHIFTSTYGKSLAFVGMFAALGSIVGIAEMQSRYVAEVFKDAVVLPDQTTMNMSIAQQESDVFGVDKKEYNIVRKKSETKMTKEEQSLNIASSSDSILKSSILLIILSNLKFMYLICIRFGTVFIFVQL